MMRRLVIGLAATALVLVGAILCFGFWLVGRPLAASRPRGELIIDSPYYGDLIPPPSDDLSAAAGDAGEVATDGDAGVTDAVQLAIVRTEKRATPPFRNTINCLLIGLDRRPGTGGGGGRTDTLIIAVIDRGSDHIGLISVPRDLYVMIPDVGPGRINAVNPLSYRAGHDGTEALKRVIQDTLAIPIHHTIAVDLGLFERSVDAVGGVTVDVPCPIVDNFVDPREPAGRRLLDVRAGRQHMDGITAAMYVRSRHGRSDWDRARRQQAVLLGLRARLLSLGGLSRLPTLWDELGESVQTDMSRLDLFQLARRLLQADPAHLHGMVIDHQQTEHWTTPEGSWVLLPKFDEIDRALDGLFSAPSPGSMPGGSHCAPADVALTRPEHGSLRRRVEEADSEGSSAPQLSRDHSPPPPPSSEGATGSNPDHSSSPDGLP
jgi:LCP family protein required for cell wall assembly